MLVVDGGRGSTVKVVRRRWNVCVDKRCLWWSGRVMVVLFVVVVRGIIRWS